MAAVAEKIIRIDVIASANAQRTLNALASDMKKVETATDKMQKSVSAGFGGLTSTFSKMMQFFGGGALIVSMGALSKAILDSATSYQVLEARLALVLGGTDKAARATEQIMDIAKLTGREIDGVSKLYEKAARSAQQFGVSEDKVREITLGFAQSIKLSGASTQEAYASLVQFGQALASGRLQGDEFRSLMENNAVFMYEFAKAAGITVAELRKMGTEGKLNAKFLFDTMAKEGADGLNMMQRLDKMAREVPLTFAQSLNSMQTALSEFAGVMAKTLDARSTDQLGLFGPLIRGVTSLTQSLRELVIESNAMDEGFFGRIMRLLDLIGKFTPGGLLKGALGFGDKSTLAERINNETNDALTALNTARERLEKAKLGKVQGALTNPALEKRALEKQPELVAKATAEVEKAELAYIRLRKAQSDISYGERYTGPSGKPVPVVDPAADRRQKAAAESLKDFVEGLERQAEASRRVAAGLEETKKSATDLVALEGKLKEAHAGVNSKMAERGRLAIQNNERNTEAVNIAKEVAKAEEKRGEAEKTQTDNLREQILRDTEAIDALKNRSRATDEYTEAMLRRERAALSVAVSERMEVGGFSTKDPVVAQMLERIKLYDQAITKKNELMGTRAEQAQFAEQGRIDEAKRRKFDSLADEINTSLKKGLLDGNKDKSIGEQLLANLRDTFRNKTLDIIINPITTIISRVLAQLADQFSSMITRSLFEAMANRSSDPIGSLMGLLTGGFGSSGAGSAGVDYSLPTTGVRLATGMDFVPFDNFPALLHRGERVVTAKDNARPSTVTISYNPTIQVDARSDAAQVASIAAEVTAQGQRDLLDSLRANGVLAS